MYWTLELATKLEDAPWPATKDELLDYAIRSGAPQEIVENLQEIHRGPLARLSDEGGFLLPRGRVLKSFELIRKAR